MKDSGAAYLETHSHQGLGRGFGSQVELPDRFEEIDMSLARASGISLSGVLYLAEGIL